MNDLKSILQRLDRLGTHQSLPLRAMRYVGACDEHDIPRLADLFTTDGVFCSTNAAMVYSENNISEPLAIAVQNSQSIVGRLPKDYVKSAHFVDTKQVPWVIWPDLPDIGLKILRVSEDNSYISLIARQNGVASGHTYI